MISGFLWPPTSIGEVVPLPGTKLIQWVMVLSYSIKSQSFDESSFDEIKVENHFRPLTFH